MNDGFPLETQSLRIFVAVAETGSVSQAARRLNYVQPNVSARIRGLEREVGARLFERGSRGMELTPAGRSLLGYARPALALIAQARRVIRDTETPAGVLRIGSTDTFASTTLAPLISGFMEHYPEISVQIETATSRRLHAQLRDHELDAAIVEENSEDSDIFFYKLREESLVLVGRHNDTSGQQALNAPFIGFPDHCPYKQALFEWLDEHRHSRECSLEISGLEAMVASVSAGLGITVLPESVARNYGDRLRLLEHPRFTGTIGLYTACLTQARTLPAIEAFMDHTAEFFDQAGSAGTMEGGHRESYAGSP